MESVWLLENLYISLSSLYVLLFFLFYLLNILVLNALLVLLYFLVSLPSWLGFYFLDFTSSLNALPYSGFSTHMQATTLFIASIPEFATTLGCLAYSRLMSCSNFG